MSEVVDVLEEQQVFRQSVPFNTLPAPSTQHPTHGKGGGGGSHCSEKKKNSHNRDSAAIKGRFVTWSQQLKEDLQLCPEGAASRRQHPAGGGGPAEASSQPLECRESSPGKSHGPATPLLAVDSGDPDRALGHPSPQMLSREALLGPGRTVLPDV